ncbi:hypothetical protein THAOC_32759, partial [Thalassiosira oceanica]
LEASRNARCAMRARGRHDELGYGWAGRATLVSSSGTGAGRCQQQRHNHSEQEGKAAHRWRSGP